MSARRAENVAEGSDVQGTSKFVNPSGASQSLIKRTAVSEQPIIVLSFVHRNLFPKIIRPAGCVLGLSRPPPKPAVKLAHKPASSLAASNANAPRRKRLNTLGEKTIIKSRPNIRLKKPRLVQTKSPHLPGGEVLTMSVSEFYQAADRMISRLPRSAVSERDVAFLDTLFRASFRHDIAAVVKVNTKYVGIRGHMIRPLQEHAIIVRQLGEEEKRVQLASKRKRESQETKAYWDKLVDDAMNGEESPEQASDEDYSTWVKYRLRWDDFEAGVSVESTFDFEELPWPTLTRGEDLKLEDYEEFILSPLRPGYRTMRWTERLKEERRLWNVVHVKTKVAPFAHEDIRDDYVEVAEIVNEYLEELIGKYCDC
ncbi:hypothetical protein V5O48_017072 [Marasmius crinis-equi]|uniref:Uncharacterized protein n=1 Tax=Marasmius crinis-equi TaxID=585013 RepID=A0ABR3EQ09_9AGAR